MTSERGRSASMDEVMVIPVGHYCLRSFTDDDVQALVKYANNREVSRTLRDSFPYPYTAEDAYAWICLAKVQNPETAFAIATADELIGVVGFHIQPDVYRCSAELGYWLGEPFWGKGIATLAVKAMTEFGFSESGLHRMFANVFESNPASMRVLEKAGYTLEGRLRKAVLKEGRLMDQYLYAIVR